MYFNAPIEVIRTMPRFCDLRKGDRFIWIGADNQPKTKIDKSHYIHPNGGKCEIDFTHRETHVLKIG